jgi:hypothetical protein
MLVEQAQTDPLERLRDRDDLGEDVDAVLVLVDHALQPADLTLDAAQPVPVVVLVHRVAPHRFLPLLRWGTGV